MIKTLISFFILGLSFGLGPCLASCGPLVISYIAGTHKNTVRAFFAYLIFSLSRISVYIALALGLFLLGRYTVGLFLAQVSAYLFALAGAFVVFLGVVMLLGKMPKMKFCATLHRKMLEQDKKSIVLLGLVMGILPCAPLVATLALIGTVSRFWVESVTYSIAFGLGTLISPLVILAALTGLIPRLLGEHLVIYQKVLDFICGLIIIFLGVQLFLRIF